MADEKLTDTELTKVMIKALSKVQLGALYRHNKSGNYYVAKDVTLREEDLEPMVSYSPLRVGMVRFSRPLSEFTERFLHHNEHLARR